MVEPTLRETASKHQVLGKPRIQQENEQASLLGQAFSWVRQCQAAIWLRLFQDRTRSPEHSVQFQSEENAVAAPTETARRQLAD